MPQTFTTPIHSHSSTFEDLSANCAAELNKNFFQSKFHKMSRKLFTLTVSMILSVPLPLLTRMTSTVFTLS
jgi:hypothetical protein